MVALETPQAELGMKAPDFTLRNVDGKAYSLNQLKGEKGTVILFICNHCPYVQRQLDRFIALTKQLADEKISVIAINSNDAEQYPEDSFEAMQELANTQKIPFPYLHDETQDVASRYHAVCTPDIYGFNAALELQYRGRLDQSWSGVIENPQEDLLLAMRDIAQSGKTERSQHPSIGCSIKWKTSKGAVA